MRGTRVLVHHAVHAQLDAAVATCAGQPEAGGILLGSYRGRDLEIVGHTKPGVGDRRSAHFFERRDAAHQSAADTAWATSGGTVTFVGEWHTHPAGEVQPSTIDLQTWRSQARAIGQPMVYALAAPSGWGIFLVKPRLLRPSVMRLVQVEAGRVGSVFR